MNKAKLALLAALLLALGLAAQEPAAPESGAPTVGARSIEVKVPGGAVLNFRPRGKTQVDLHGTPRAVGAVAAAKVEVKDGWVEIEMKGGDVEGLPPATALGPDYLTYVLWVVPMDGGAQNVGELAFEDGKFIDLSKVTTPYRTFWLMVTAEPDFAVREPSPAVALVSVNQDQTRTSNKAQPVPATLAYYTHFDGYASGSPAVLISGVPDSLRQARRAMELAQKAGVTPEPAPQPAAAGGTADGGVRASQLLWRADWFVKQAEDEMRRNGDTPELDLYARAAAQLAEGARALAVGAVGPAEVLRLTQEMDKQKAEAERQITSLQDRSKQIDAALDAERRRTRDLEGQMLALREQASRLGEEQKSSQAEAERLQRQGNRICDELRRQLVSMGQFMQQGDQLALNLASDTLFDSGHYELKPAAREVLAKLAALRATLFPDAPVRFEGHTDLVGDADYNQWLSEQRALSVYQYFLQDRLTRIPDPDEQAELQKRLDAVDQLLEQNYNTARRQKAQRQQALAVLSNAVTGKGMREPLVAEKGPNEQNRRVTIVFAVSSLGELTPVCPVTPAAPTTGLPASQP